MPRPRKCEPSRASASEPHRRPLRVRYSSTPSHLLKCLKRYKEFPTWEFFVTLQAIDRGHSTFMQCISSAHRGLDPNSRKGFPTWEFFVTRSGFPNAMLGPSGTSPVRLSPDPWFASGQPLVIGDERVSHAR